MRSAAANAAAQVASGETDARASSGQAWPMAGNLRVARQEASHGKTEGKGSVLIVGRGPREKRQEAQEGRVARSDALSSAEIADQEGMGQDKRDRAAHAARIAPFSSLQWKCNFILMTPHSRHWLRR